MCNSATATESAVGLERGDDAPATLAAQLGDAASDDQLERAEAALSRVISDQRRLQEPGEGRGEAPAPEDILYGAFPAAARGDNLVANLAGVIRDQAGAGDVPHLTIPKVRGLIGEDARRGPAALSVDAISASVRSRLRGKNLEAIPGAERIVAGALLAAAALADERNPPLGWVAEAADEVRLRPPWEVTHPVLLDPMIWLLSTAYHLS